MSIDKIQLERIFANGYNVLFEADQTKMTERQVANDVKKRNNAQDIGMEIEFYSDMDMYDVSRYIESELGIVRGDGKPSWIVEGDSSLTATGSMNSYNDSLINGENFPSNTVMRYRGDDALDELVIEYIDDIGIFQHLAGIHSELINISPNTETISGELISAEISKNMKDSKYSSIDDECSEKAITYLVGENAFSPDNISDSMRDELISIYTHDEEFEHYLQEECYDNDHEFDHLSPSSHREYGIEIKFNGPRKLNSKEHILDEVEKIMTDPEISPVTVYGDDEENAGETGLHVHFGLASHNVTNLDLVRLVINTVTNMDKISELGRRGPGYWQKGVEEYVDTLDEFVDGTIDDVFIPTDKFFGTSFLHISGKGTVEFRWAHASVAEDRDNLSNYIDLLVRLVNESFTGSNELEYRGRVIKEAGLGKDITIPRGYVPSRRLIVVDGDEVSHTGSMRDNSYTVANRKNDWMHTLRENMTNLKSYDKKKKDIYTSLPTYIDKCKGDIDYSDPLEVKKELKRLQKTDPNSAKSETSSILFVDFLYNELKSIERSQKRLQDSIHTAAQRFKKKEFK